MTLSEAIRLGAMLKSQAFNSGLKGSCALRAACDALGLPDDKLGIMPYMELWDRWPMLARITSCPEECCSWGETDMIAIVWHLNDTHKMTREQIADWVEGVEQAHAARETLAAVDPQVQVLESVTTRA